MEKLAGECSLFSRHDASILTHACPGLSIPMHTVLLDTKGPEIRTGFFANDATKISLTKGETIILTSDYTFRGDSKKLACSYPALVTSVNPGKDLFECVASVSIWSTATNNVAVSS